LIEAVNRLIGDTDISAGLDREHNVDLLLSTTEKLLVQIKELSEYGGSSIPSAERVRARAKEWLTGREDLPVEKHGLLLRAKIFSGQSYAFVSRDGAPGQVQIKFDEEGIVVDLCNDDENSQPFATAYATYTDLELE